MSVPLLYESHCHTPLCKHAIGWPTEYAAVAEQRGLKGIIITCHAPLPDNLGIDHRMGPEEFDRYVELVAAARAEFAGRVFCVRANLVNLPFTHVFDLIFSTAAFHWVTDHPRLFRNLFGALKRVVQGEDEGTLVHV